MNVKDLRELMPYLVKTGIPLWLWGQHGKGKSETFTKAFTDIGWWTFNHRMNTQSDVADTLGLQDFTIDSTTGEKVATKHFMPSWLYEAIEFCKANPDKGAFIFFDEVNRAARFELLGPIFQMSLDKRLHTTEFPSNLYIGCASNPSTADYSLLNVKDKALLSRFLHVHFDPEVSEWAEYTKEKKYEKDLVDFFLDNTDCLEEPPSKAFSISDYAKPDRRKVGMMDALIKVGLPDNLFMETMAGLFGTKVTHLYLENKKKKEKPVDINLLLNDYDMVRDYLTEAVNNNRTDVVNKAVNDLITKLKDEKEQEVSEIHGRNVVRFANDLPNDFMFSLMHGIFCLKGFHEFADKNFPLFSDIEKRLIEIRRDVNPDKVKDLLN